MRVHYPELCNMAYTISLCMFSLFSKDLNFISYSAALQIKAGMWWPSDRALDMV